MSENVNPGDRVLTLVIGEDGAELYRPGTYLGKERYPGGGNTDATRDNPRYRAWGRRNALNPKIELDDGTVVWGCECWWQKGGMSP